MPAVCLNLFADLLQFGRNGLEKRTFCFCVNVRKGKKLSVSSDLQRGKLFYLIGLGIDLKSKLDEVVPLVTECQNNSFSKFWPFFNTYFFGLAFAL